MLTTTPALDREALSALIPHAEGMNLHDEVMSWDTEQIHCRSHGHQSTDNVLRLNEQLSALHLIEYGAQAMAIHGGLLAAKTGKAAKPGFLASVRKADFFVERLDDLLAPIDIRATRQAGGDSGWTYDFKASAADQTLATGRVSVMFAPQA